MTDFENLNALVVPRETLIQRAAWALDKLASTLPTQPTIREFTAADLPHALNIEKSSFPDPYSQEYFQHLLGAGSGSIADVNGKPAAYLLHRDDEEAPGYRYGHSLAVHPDYRRQGLGEALMRHMMGKHSQVSADVATNNAASKSLLKKLGFKAVRTYKDGEQRTHRMHYIKPDVNSKVAFWKQGDERTGLTCPHCGSTKTGGARAMEKHDDGRWCHANVACGDCGNGFGYDYDAKQVTSLNTHPERDRSKKAFDADEIRLLLVKRAEDDDRPFTIAVDLDGTLAKKEEPFNADSIGGPIEKAIAWVRRFHKAGARIIIFTVRGDKDLVSDWLEEHEVPYDYINENPDQPKKSSGKVLADIYRDDRAMNAENPDEHGPEILRRVKAHGGESDEQSPTIVISRHTVITITGPTLLEALEASNAREESTT